MLTELRDIGLSENEAKVYLAMLELGPATVLQIASKAAINRPTTYVQIEALKKRGLVDTLQKGKKMLFSPAEPVRLEAMLDREAKDIEVHKGELSKVLGELQTMWNLAGNKPRVRYFEGIEGLRQMQEAFLKSKEKYLQGITSVDAVLGVLPKHFNDFSPRRVKAGIRSRSIYTSGEGAILPQKDEKMLRETKFVSPEKLSFTADITIFDDSVAIASLSGTIGGTVITHPDLANSFKSLHNFMWGLIP